MANSMIIITEPNYVSSGPAEPLDDAAVGDAIAAAYTAEVARRGLAGITDVQFNVGGYDRVKNCQKHYFWITHA